MNPEWSWKRGGLFYPSDRVVGQRYMVRFDDSREEYVNIEWLDRLENE